MQKVLSGEWEKKKLGVVFDSQLFGFDNIKE
jgi:hypothetical protein